MFTSSFSSVGQLTSLLSSLWCRHIISQRWLWNNKSWNLLYLGHGELHCSVEALPIWSVLCWKFVGKNWKFHLPPYHCTGRTWKHGVLVFHGRDAFCYVSESETNDHVSATFLLSHFRSFLFPLRFQWRFFKPMCKIAWSMLQKFCLCVQSRWIKVNLLEIGPLNGSHALNTRTHCIDETTVKCARLPLFSILSD